MTKCNYPYCPREGTTKMIARTNEGMISRKLTQMVCSTHMQDLLDYGWGIEA